MSHRLLLWLATVSVAGCATPPADTAMPPPDPATLDCPALAQQVARTEAQLRQLGNRPNVGLTIGLGGNIGSHGSIGITLPVPLGQPDTPSADAVRLEQLLSRLRQWQQQKHCPEAPRKTP